MSDEIRKRHRKLPSPTAAPIDLERELAAMEEVRKRVCASRESAREFLVKAGFYTEDGKLTEQYR